MGKKAGRVRQGESYSAENIQRRFQEVGIIGKAGSKRELRGSPRGKLGGEVGRGGWARP